MNDKTKQGRIKSQYTSRGKALRGKHNGRCKGSFGGSVKGTAYLWGKGASNDFERISTGGRKVPNS